MQNEQCKMHSALALGHSALCIMHFSSVHLDILTTSVYSWI
jgi:hypothetical protein